jgi:plasmid stabilization system protein ParE
VSEPRGGRAAAGADPPGLAADGVDNPIERLKLLAANDADLSAYLDSLELASPREREMLREIARDRPLRDPAAFPRAHRNAAEALESLARHGYRGTAAGRRLGPLRPLVRWGIELVGRYVVVSYIRHVTRTIRNLMVVREIQALPGSPERESLTIARQDAERMVEALKAREIGIPTFLIGGALVPIVASIGNARGWLENEVVATAIGVAGILVGLLLSWFVLRGAALASRRIRLSTAGPLRALWDAVGWCGDPPRHQGRRFATVAIVLTVGVWIILPVLVGVALAT